jgi:hypothetical protein
LAGGPWLRDPPADFQEQIDENCIRCRGSCVLAGGFGVTLQTESTHDWSHHQWTIPVGVFVSQALKNRRAGEEF